MAGYRDVCAQIVRHDYVVAGAGSGAAVDATGGDGVGVDQGYGGRNGEGEDGSVHIEGDCSDQLLCLYIDRDSDEPDDAELGAVRRWIVK